jgi:hypothetical protein
MNCAFAAPRHSVVRSGSYVCADVGTSRSLLQPIAEIAPRVTGNPSIIRQGKGLPPIRPKPDCGFLHARVMPHERPSQHREFSQFLTKQESVKGLIPPYVGSAQRRRPVVRTSPN